MFNQRGLAVICRRWALVAVAAVAGIGLCQSVSCAPEAQQPAEQRLADTGRPAMHAVFSEELKADMMKLQRLHSSQMRAELYAGNPFRPNMDKVSEAAASMEKAATHIPESIKTLQMDPQERRLFLSLSEKLRAEAVQLKKDADNRDYSAATGTMDRVTATCNACHAAFRSLPGVPPISG